MTQQQKIKLYGNEFAPMVQPVMIALLEKGANFEVENINIYDRPDWFAELSPTDKVPVLEVDGTILFESAVIIEYLDDILAPQLQPRDPLERARNRAWTAFATNVLMDSFHLMMARQAGQFNGCLNAMKANYAKLEEQLKDGPYFNGPKVSLIDFTYAAVFLRQDILDRTYDLDVLSSFEKISAWSKAVLDRPSTLASVPDNFEEVFIPRVMDTFVTSQKGGRLAIEKSEQS